MPTYVDPNKCDGCKALDRPACMYICPNDLMTLDRNISRAFNQEPDHCWECYSCVKICPQGAIGMRGYADVMPLGASMVPMRGTDSIIWAAQYRDGTTKRFRFPIRTTPWGSIKPFEGAPDPTVDDLKQPTLAAEARWLEAELATPKK
ncbi:MAG: adenylyl-sulfate reductase subunit beta [Chloroflexi bacterium]|nr:adenylyl-sulfate reductase subunit beta [Chloroflexota bacterium]